MFLELSWANLRDIVDEKFSDKVLILLYVTVSQLRISIKIAFTNQLTSRKV